MSAEQHTATRPTRVRYAIVLVTASAAFLLYLHRFCMSYAQRYVKEDLGLSDDELGLCFAAFFLAYALAQVPAGWFSDRFGARVMLTVYILVWSLFTALMGLTTGLVMLLAVRLAAGLGQAGAYPTSAALLARWVPLTSRGQANSIVAFGGRFGGGLAPVLTVTLIVALVPMEVSALLQERDLLDARHLCEQLAAADAAQDADPAQAAADRVRGEVFGELRPETQAAVRAVAAAAVPAGAEPTPLPQQTTTALRADLNRIIKRDAALVTSPDSPLPLEREARKLLGRSRRSGIETQRLNRLVLEAVLPDGVRKIYVHGWRPVMYIYGALGLIVALAFWWVFRDRPADHAGCNAQEQALIAAGRDDAAAGRDRVVRAAPLGPMVRSRSLWLMCVSQWGGNVGWVFLVTWLPRYLLEVHSAPLVERGWMASIPLWVGWCGMLAGGRLTDLTTRRLGLRWGRIAPLSCGRFVAMAAYLFCLTRPSAWVTTAAFAVVAFSNDMGNASSWAYKQDVGGQYVGSIHGWANMWGNLGATLSPILLQLVVRSYGWDAAFATCAAAFGIAGLATLGVDATIPIVRDEPRDEPTTDP